MRLWNRLKDERGNRKARSGLQGFPVLKDRIVIVVDVGLASGYTMLAAFSFVKNNKPGKIIVAAPTASKRTVGLVLLEVDESESWNE